VGRNNLSTTFGGVISGDGSVTKIGAGRLILAHENTYTGATHIQRGRLLVTNRAGSATGTGDVAVDGGTFGGTGMVAGAVTVGTGSGSRAVLSPGKSGIIPGTLTILNTLALGSDATYKVALNSDITGA